VPSFLVNALETGPLSIKNSDMPKFDERQTKEINAIIDKITKGLKDGCEICACDPKVLKTLLSNAKINKSIKSYACRPEYSSTLVSYFAKEKSIPASALSRNAQSSICLIYA
jgi:hypothetical protein